MTDDQKPQEREERDVGYDGAENWKTLSEAKRAEAAGMSREDYVQWWKQIEKARKSGRTGMTLADYEAVHKRKG